MTDFLDTLFALIEDRQAHPVEGSYTNLLLARGIEKIAQKVGEEGIEVVVAALHQSDERVIEESADLLYHLLVLLAYRGLTLEAVRAELSQRHQPRAADSPPPE